MAFVGSGHGTQNDDLTNGRPVTLINQGADQRWAASGGPDGNVETSYDRDVDRSRKRGAAPIAGVTLDQGQANESRELQMGSLAMLESAARGNAPSRAVALGQMGTETSMRNGMAGSGAGRGVGGALMAMRNAQAATGQQMSAGNQQVADMRAQEMGRAQQGFASNAQAARGQDILAATTNAQLEARRRELQEQRQQANERMAWDTRHTQLQSANEWKTQQDGADMNRRRASAAQSAEDRAATMDNVNMGLGVGGMLSDERTKRSVIPMGSLSGLGGRR